VDFSILVPDNVVFHRCSFERVTIAGKATGSFLGCSFDATDISGLLLHDSAIRSSRRTDLTLPATPACFYVPGDALRGPLEPIRASVRNHMLQATLNGSLDAGLVVNAEEIRRMGGRGQEADRVVDALWQHHITNLSEATTPVA
jgi:hypothetical protein